MSGPPGPVDPATLSTDGASRRVDKPWGYEIHWTPPDRPYVGKVLHIDAGKRLSFQMHDAKLESWLLMAGRAKMLWDGPDGLLVETELEPGLGYSCVIGQRHRLIGITDCDVLEVSTPEIGTTYRLDDDYARSDETEAVRRSDDRGWSRPGESRPAG
ncbi:MAG TPA: cupin [Acidimicrobiia bacterium]|nr:cupin [Acidimicrobiia bacterium]